MLGWISHAQQFPISGHCVKGFGSWLTGLILEFSCWAQCLVFTRPKTKSRTKVVSFDLLTPRATQCKGSPESDGGIQALGCDMLRLGATMKDRIVVCGRPFASPACSMLQLNCSRLGPANDSNPLKPQGSR